MNKKIVVDGVEYAAVVPNGNRFVFVLDRGWIVAGDAGIDADGVTVLSRVVHVRRWESIGFDGMLANPKSDKVTLKPINFKFEIPKGVIIFAVRVDNNWGL